MINPVNKYYAKKVYDEVYGMFGSKKEYSDWMKHILMQKSGLIHDLKRQVNFVVIDKTDKFRDCKYRADIVYKDKEDNIHVVDTKGMKSGEPYEKFIMKKKLMYIKYGIVVEEI